MIIDECISKIYGGNDTNLHIGDLYVKKGGAVEGG